MPLSETDDKEANTKLNWVKLLEIFWMLDGITLKLGLDER